MRADGKRRYTGYTGLSRSHFLRFLILILAFFSVLAFLPGSSASPDEVYGVVTNVIDGDTFDLRVEKADSRIENSEERITLADVRSPDMKTIPGPAARDFTYAVLMDRRVYLDLDDHSEQGRDGEGRLVAVAYLAGAYGQPISYPNFNLLLVNAGHALLANQTDNEFDPKDWEKASPESSRSDPLQEVEESLRERLSESLENSGRDQQDLKNDGLQNDSQNDSQNGLLSRIEEAAGERLDRAGQAAWDWLRAEITNTSLELVNSSLDQALNRS